ncbi:N-succinylarginine dihydrolase [Endozoicomonas sp. Mp262]|uniref:N-succinylarginine dihydrolase n=1 Tax=Endozoicomonas sp. Mp262 TaxID=2919499 RepID=UPI0021DA7856
MKATEANFDGLVGPTHNYAGLSYGNVASTNNQTTPSNPRLAALQGLEKMKALYDLGLVQGVLPPQERPDLATLRKLGFTGNDTQVLNKAAKQVPEILAACCSASSMWTANAATVSPSSDTGDGRVHFTPANLVNKFHRSIESLFTGKVLKKVFPDEQHFCHHSPLPGVSQFGDEGAANHTRFCKSYGEAGVELFVYGASGFNHPKSQCQPKHFPARQTREASEAIVRNHLLQKGQVVYAQQNPDVIDQGVFHNDVIAVGNKNILFCHEKSFLNQHAVYQQIKKAFNTKDFTIIEVPDNRITVKQAVNSYLFNSQLVSTPDKEILIVPSECEEHSDVSLFLGELVNGNMPISEVLPFDLRQSMKNGGGPACLRLRVVLSKSELDCVNQSCLFSSPLFKTLQNWINKHYRDKLSTQDLSDPLLLDESRNALDSLSRILGLGNIYHFQE